MKFAKYEALSNDYIVVEASDCRGELAPALVRRICDRHRGLGADGVLLADTDSSVFRVRIFNPDGGEAEKSGNGLRILCRYLYDRGLVDDGPFGVETPGGRVRCEVLGGGQNVTVDMGRVSFESGDIPVTGPPREVLEEPITAAGRDFVFSAATIGNPHCVVICDSVSEEDARTLGPALECDPRFPNRTNVQLVEVLDRRTIRIEIWERGAGYTLASGTSSCAAAAVAYRLRHCERKLDVQMPGGTLRVELSLELDARIAGPVSQIAAGTLARELVDRP